MMRYKDERWETVDGDGVGNGGKGASPVVTLVFLAARDIKGDIPII